MKTSSYKGFETWLSGLRMSLKMYLYILVAFGIFHIILSFCFLYYRNRDLIREISGYLVWSIQLHHPINWPGVALYGKYLWSDWLYLLLIFGSLYLIYPFVLMLFKGRATDQAKTQYLRGVSLIPDHQFAAEIGKGDLPIGSFRLPWKEENKHCFIVGRPGTGKTVFLSQVVYRLSQRKEKAIIYDPKGDYTESFFDPSRDILFNPLDQRSTGWCIFDDLKTQLDINSISLSLIPPTFLENSFWHDGARAVFSGLIHYLWKEDMRTNEGIWKAVTQPGADIYKALNSIPEGKAGARFVENPDSPQAKGIFATMMQYAQAFQFMNDSSESISLVEWLNSKDSGFIFVTNQADTQDTLRPILSLFIDYLGKKLLSLPDDLNRRIFFILDEFGSLQRLSSIKDLLTVSRSKGGSCWIGIQDMGQLRKLYTPDIANTIVNACGTSVMFAVSDPDTAQYLVRKIGDTEIIETEETHSMGVENYRDGVSMTSRRKRQPLLLNSDFMTLADLHAYVKIPNSPFVTVTEFPVYNYKKKMAPFIIRDNLNLSNIVVTQEEIRQEVEQKVFTIGKSDKYRSIGTEPDIEGVEHALW